MQAEQSGGETTPRKQVAQAFAFTEPQRLPVDLGASRSSSINGLAYARLLDRLHAGGMIAEKPPISIFDVRQYLALVDAPVADWAATFFEPLYPLRPAAGLRMNRWKEGWMPGLEACRVPEDFNPVTREDGIQELLDAEGAVAYRRASGGLYFEDAVPRFTEPKEPSFFDSLPASPPTVEAVEWTRSECRRLATSSRAVVATTPFSFFERGIKDFGYEEWLVLLLTEPKSAAAYFEWLYRDYVALIDSVAADWSGLVDVVLFSDDLGAQTGPIIAPSTYREMIFPFHRRLITHLHSRLPSVKTLLHSCGSVRQFIPHFLEAGFDALNPVQFTAAGMDAAALKRDFGTELLFWGGGIDTQGRLSSATPEEVRSDARRMIDILAPSGGYVFAAVHNIQADVPPQNIEALFEEARRS